MASGKSLSLLTDSKHLRVRIIVFFLGIIGLIACDANLVINIPIEETTHPPPEAVTDNHLEQHANGPKEKMGEWAQIPLPPEEDRMQGVHTVLLPTGKVLMVSGSSNRNTLTDNGIQDGSDVRNYEAINNMGIFDPQTGTLARIDVPLVPAEAGASNDLFCAGQLHLPNGDVLFVGGSQAYYPGELFEGTSAARVFHWRTEQWETIAPSQDGHWYPSLLPLEDGRLAVFSGLRFGRINEISTMVEIYDYSQEGSAAWQSVDIRSLPNNPFFTPLSPDSTQIDAFQLYPRLFSLADGRILLTHDGAGFASDAGDQSKNTYFVKIGSPGSQGDTPAIEFTPGPKRLVNNRIYGTAVADPNTGDILLIGGQQGPALANNNDNGPGPFAHKGVEVTSHLERYSPPDDENVDGSWKITENFLGDSPQDARMMHYAVILPTKQLLVVNGGNYAYHRPLFYPLLLTPSPAAPGGYTKKQMNQALQPRLYHGVALLLPDGRVFTGGGNAARAAYDPEGGSVKLNVFKDPHGVYSVHDQGEFGIPAEIWQIELFSPPYLFIAGPRPVIKPLTDFSKNDDDYPLMVYNQEYTISIENITENGSLVLIKLGAVTHGWDSGQRLITLQPTSQNGDHLVFTAPEPSPIHPPGYYMLFYVNDKGKPSEARVVQFSDVK